MTLEAFKQLIEAPATGKKVFLDKICTKGIIQRTIRITLQYPEMAEQYLASVPKAVNENIPTPSTSNETE